jgi:hypothetical protein
MNVRNLWIGRPPLKRKKKWHTIGAIIVGALTTLRTFGLSNWRKLMVVNRTCSHLIMEPLGTSSLKEGAAGPVGE